MANFTWSYSALKEYENCPKKYYEIRVAQNYTVIPSEKMIYGTEVHKALEDYVRDGKELALNYLRFKPAVDSLKDIPGDKYPEFEMALYKDRIFPHFPQVNKIKAGLLFVMNNVFITEEYKREDIESSWGKFTVPLARLDNSYESNTWNANPTPLCKFCPVKTCEFNRT
jgi:CRISPR/Cas system-associated exonuclease Cas4 (RecB family)